MAIKIDIPGIGEVSVEGAAEEDTLEKIRILASDALKISKANLKALESMAKQGASTTAATPTTPNAAPQAAAAEDAKNKLKDLGNSAADAAAKNKGWAAAGANFANSLKNLGVTATTVASKFLTDYDSIAADPIKASAELVNTGIDVVTDFTAGLTSAIPVVGDFVAGMAKAAAELLKAANAAFANQLQKNVKALQDYAKIGTSFAGGMVQMQQAGVRAGLGISEFSKVVVQSRENLNFLGMSGSDAAMKLSSALAIAADKSRAVGKSGASLREEMFKMGYTYEEQGELMSSYMAQMAATGKLRSMSDKEIAEGTRKYARDLKVISDITGQDAKKLAEKARAEVMRGSLMNRLQGDQKTAFIGVNSAVSKFGPKIQDAITQFMTLGQVTDPVIAAQPNLVQAIKTSAAAIQSGSENAAEISYQAMVDASTRMKSNQSFYNSVDRALVANVGGLAAEIAQQSNQFMAATAGLDRDAFGKSRDAAEASAGAQDDLTKNTTKMYEETKKFAIIMETEVNKHLSDYAKILAKVNEMTIETFLKGISTANKAFKEDTRPMASAADEALDQALKAEAAIKEKEIADGKSFFSRLFDASEEAKAAAKATEEARKKLYEQSGRSAPERVKEYNKGGIASGSDSGFLAKLHGTEAVVPLPDNKSIPVQLALSGMENFEVAPGLQRFSGYNQGPMKTDLRIVTEMAKKLGAFDDQMQVITDPKTWQQLLSYGTTMDFGTGVASPLGTFERTEEGQMRSGLPDVDVASFHDKIEEMVAHFKEAREAGDVESVDEYAERTMGKEQFAQMIDGMRELANYMKEQNSSTKALIDETKRGNRTAVEILQAAM